MSGLTGNNILAGSSGQGGYEIEQSLRFNDDDSAYLSRTPASAGNRKTWTWSGWFKNTTNAVDNTFIDAFVDTNNECVFRTNGNLISFVMWDSGAYKVAATTAAIFRDPSAWYHIVLAVDTTQATNSDGVKIWVNGVQQTLSFSAYTQNNDGRVNDAVIHRIGLNAISGSNRYTDGYLAEVNFIDGQALTQSDFGETDLLTNQWIPKKYVGTYGTNGFYLNFRNSASLGADSSGNGNNWTPNNLAATDQVLDSPTNNFCTLPSTSKSTYLTLSEGNLKTLATSSSYWATAHGSFGISSGKWYWEVYLSTSSVGWNRIGIQSSSENVAGNQNVLIGNTVDSWCYKVGTGESMNNSTTYTYGAAAAQGDVIGVAFDMDAGTLVFYKNGVSQGTAFSSLSGTYVPATSVAIGDSANGNISNFGQDSSFSGNKTAQGNTDANGIGDFYHAPPSGYLALCEDNLPDPSIALSGEHFNTYLWTGDNSSPRSITGIGFQPDLTWIKRRSSAKDHALFDAVRGSTLKLESNQTDAEVVGEQGKIDSFDSDGFTVSTGTTDNSQVNISGSTYVAWNWKADNTSGSSNTDGTITSTVSANTTAGFSIVTYTGDANGSSTVGHGLGAAPDVVIVKRRDVADGWPVYHSSLGVSKVIELHSTSGEQAGSNYWGSAITSTTFGLSAGGSNNRSGSSNVAYCFAEVEGYSKFGSYTGNGSADGTFVYTGFKPAFVIIKRTDVSGDSWFMFDTARDTFNPLDSWLGANLSNTEGSNTFADSLSNGFKLRGSISAFNASGGTYIYMAFAESPFKYSNAR